MVFYGRIAIHGIEHQKCGVHDPALYPEIRHSEVLKLHSRSGELLIEWDLSIFLRFTNDPLADPRRAFWESGCPAKGILMSSFEVEITLYSKLASG